MIGTTLAHYRVVDQLGAGGMGEVYLARDTRLERDVAIKVLPPAVAADPDRLTRFRREALTLARLSHPNIVTVHAIEEAGGGVLLVMEYVRGETLAAHVPHGGLERADFFALAVALADALAAAHQAGVVHRDLKPTNVMIDERGAPRILDFGIAKLRASSDAPLDTRAATEPLTGPHQIVGTAPYMAPEQIQGEPVDERSDIFSLGIVLYQMATGRRPFAGESGAAVASAILRDTPSPADEIRGELPHHLGRILRHCLEKDPEKRLQSAKDLRNDLADLERELTTAARTAPAQTRRRRARPRLRRPLALAAGLALLALLAGLGLWQIAPSGAGPPLAPEARRLVEQAELRLARGHTGENLDAAEERYRRALELEPGRAEIQARLAGVLAITQYLYPERGLAEEVRHLAAAALADDSDLAPARVALGSLALLEGDAAAAEREARRTIAAAPEDHHAYSLLGRALLAQERADEALIALGRGVEASGGDASARVALARTLADLGRLDQAAGEYVEILDHDPDYRDALNNLAVIYTRTGRDLDAAPLFMRLLQLDPADDFAAQNLGVIYFNLDRLDEAVEFFELSHRLNPAKPTAPHALGEAHERRGDAGASRRWFETAVATYDAALAAGGSRSYLLGLRAFCAAKLGRFAEARANVAEALELEPDSGYRLFNAAQVHALAGDRERLLHYAARSLAAGYPRQEFHRDPAFAGYRGNPAFRALVESGPR